MGLPHIDEAGWVTIIASLLTILVRALDELEKRRRRNPDKKTAKKMRSDNRSLRLENAKLRAELDAIYSRQKEDSG